MYPLRFGAEPRWRRLLEKRISQGDLPKVPAPRPRCTTDTPSLPRYADKETHENDRTGYKDYSSDDVMSSADRASPCRN